MNELHIYFVDLIAFVPDSDGSVWVLLPEARQPRVASDGMTMIDPHFPILLFDRDNSGNEGDWESKPGKKGIHELLKLEDPPGNHLAWLLERQELKISIPSDLPVQAPGAASTGLPTSANARDFTWVPALAAHGIPAKIDSDCLKPQAPSAKIVARLHLEAGTLTTYQFAKRPEPLDPQSIRVPRLELKPLTGGIASGPLRACADMVVAKIPFTGSEVVVSAVDLENGQEVPGRKISLQPTGSVVNLLIGNLSPETEEEFGPPFGVHFERYYDLLFPTPTQRPIPHVDGGFPHDPASHTDTLVNEDTPLFIEEALQVPFTGFNGPICSLATLQS